MAKQKTQEIVYKYCEEMDIELPVMVLGFASETKYFMGENMNMAKPGYKILPIVHQCAGIGCHQHYFRGIILNPTLKGKELMNKLDKKYFFSNMSAFSRPRITELLSYQKILKKFGVDCNETYINFKEALYPIDLSKKALKTLCSDRLPDKLDDIIVPKEELEWKMMWCLTKWRLFILGRNCD